MKLISSLRVYFFKFVCVCVCKYRCVQATVPIWRSGNNFWESILTFLLYFWDRVSGYVGHCTHQAGWPLSFQVILSQARISCISAGITEVTCSCWHRSQWGTWDARLAPLATEPSAQYDTFIFKRNQVTHATLSDTLAPLSRPRAVTWTVCVVSQTLISLRSHCTNDITLPVITQLSLSLLP